MDQCPDSVGLLPQPREEKAITSQLVEAYLDCPTKCFLRSTGEVPTGNAFATWNHTRSEAYYLDGVRRLTAGQPQEFGSCSSEPGRWKSADWLFARSQCVSAKNLTTSLHVVQQMPPEGTSKASQLVPIRFIHSNRLSRSDKLMAGFDALVLAKALDIKIGSAKLIYGDNATTFKLRTNTVSREINKAIGAVAALLSAPGPPNLALNRHCPVCEFRDDCRKKAVERNDLSLLPNLPLKERERLNSRGIFTVSQLSYTFRPRRRIRQRAARPEKYHHALKSLAIREQKIHVVGSPQLRVDGTAVLFDVEANPYRDFYYLIGVQLEAEQGIFHHSFWANEAADEERIWRDFLNILSGVRNPILVHFGAFETVFLKTMCRRYGGPPNDSAAAKAIASAINLLSVIYAQVYFPTYSNGLKEIARFLGFEWTNSISSGLQSIIWRHEWEASGDPALRAELITYNADDCRALSLVLRTLDRISKLDFDVTKSVESESDIVHEGSLGKNLASNWHPFKSPLSELEHINRAARWNYQRDRVFVRPGTRERKKQSRENAIKKAMSGRSCKKGPQIAVVLSGPKSCPKCGTQERTRHRLLSRVVYDLVFGRNSVKGRIVKYIAQTYRCEGCGHDYGLHDAYFHGYKWGLNVRAYFIYHIVGLRVPQLTMQQNLNRLFGFDLSRPTLHNFKVVASKLYTATKQQILDRIVRGSLIHADETRANIKGRLAYVWVLTNLREVVYILAASREGQIIQELLRDFRGVLVSDFYAAYSSIPCQQQKCLIHLMRDLNDEILGNPFDEQMKSIVARFAGLLKPMVDTIDRRGLKRHFLQKHLVEVDRFYKFLEASDFRSETALKCKSRFEKNRDTLFTFLHYDGVPWNNNNAEHAIKAFAGLRDVLSGLATEASLDDYLTLLSVAETCKYQGLDFLNFLCSAETDIDTFARCRDKYRGLHRT